MKRNLQQLAHAQYRSAECFTFGAPDTLVWVSWFNLTDIRSSLKIDSLTFELHEETHINSVVAMQNSKPTILSNIRALVIQAFA